MVYIHYEKFSEIEPDIKKHILMKFGISSGTMRENAKRTNPPCVVAYLDAVPVGWSIIIPNGDEKPYINVFVSKKYRKQGIGTELILEMKNTTDEKLQAESYNKISAEFFNRFKDIKVTQW